jgi:hypothetical protein
VEGGGGARNGPSASEVADGEEVGGRGALVPRRRIAASATEMASCDCEMDNRIARRVVGGILGKSVLVWVERMK